MARITVLGGTGYAGAAVVAEAVRRGHDVTSVSRSVPADAAPGVTYLAGSILDADFLRDAVANADAVVASIPARGDLVDTFDDAIAKVIEASGAASARLVVIGGYSVLRPSAGAPRFIETGVAEQYRVEATAGWRFLQALQASAASLDWVFVSPAAKFGEWVPGEATGAYRLGGDVAMTDETGASGISAPDLALAVLDVVESGEHAREHVSVIG